MIKLLLKKILKKKSEKHLKDVKELELKCKRCHEINSIVFDKTTHTNVCNKCGESFSKLSASVSEWRSGNSEGSSTLDRCGIPNSEFTPKSNLGTFISSSRGNQFYRKFTKTSSIPFKEKSLKIVLGDLTEICKKHGIPGIVEKDAHHLYVQVTQCKFNKGKKKGQHKIIRGKNRQGVIAACLYSSCQKNNKSKSEKEIAGFFNIDVKVLTNGINKLSSLLYKYLGVISITTNTANIEDHIKNTCNNLNIHDSYCKIVIEIGRKAERLGLNSYSVPQAFAVACVYFLSHFYNLGISKTDLSKKCGLTQVTITKTFNILVPHVKDILPSKDFNVEIRKDKKTNRVFKIRSCLFSL